MLVEIETDETVKLDAPDDAATRSGDPGLWETEEEAWAYALERFGTEASKRFNVEPVVLEEAELGRPKDLKFPTVSDLARTNALVRELQDQRRRAATPPSELTPVDEQALLDLGYSPAEIGLAVGTHLAWERLALKMHGRIGRDPERIAPFLQRLEQVWLQHKGMSFMQLVTDVVAAWAGLAAPEDDSFASALEGWELEHSEDANPPRAGETERIGAFLSQVREAWSKVPDQRFGQFVGNVVRAVPEAASRADISDERFIELLSSWERAH